MTRIKQRSDGRGSLKHLQLLINKHQSYINGLIKEKFAEIANDEIDWVSPLENDEYAEYRDDGFLQKVGFAPTEIQLNCFWPKRGPQWDALAKTKNGTVILIEAKAHTKEIFSSSKAKETSKILIDQSLSEAKKFLLSNNNNDWSAKHYQYSNRLSHLFYLRIKCGKPVFLVNIYFTEDKSGIPTTEQQFREALKNLNNYLGLEKHDLSDFMTDIFINVNDLKS